MQRAQLGSEESRDYGLELEASLETIFPSLGLDSFRSASLSKATGLGHKTIASRL